VSGQVLTGEAPELSVGCGVVDPQVSLCFHPSRTVWSRSPVRSEATSPGHSPLSSTLALPFLNHFSTYISPTKQNKTKQKKHYTAAGPLPPPLSSTLSPPPPVVLASLPPAPGGPTLPHLSSPLSPTPSFLPSLRAAPPLLSPLFFVGGVASPRLPFPSTIWPLIPPLLMTSAHVFLAEGVFVHGWWVFFPLPPVVIFGVWLVVVVARLLSALSSPLLLHCLPLHGLPSILLHCGSGGGGVR
jgi:hypothetical protein